MAAGFVEKVSEQVSFAAKVPMLMKATADNETPTSGYLYKEINQITFDSVSNCQLLVKFLNERLKKSSPHVKYKTLKIMTYLSANGQSEFRSALRHQSEQIKQAASFNGEMSALHGDALNQKVRKTATELIELLFNIENPESAQQSFIMAGPTGKKMEGFGNTPMTPSTNMTLLDKMKNLTSQIPELSGYIKTKQDLVSNDVNLHGNKSVPSCLSGTGTSAVKFVNYHNDDSEPWTIGRESDQSSMQFTTGLLSNDDDDDDNHEATCDEDTEDGDGILEGQLVDKITQEGGVKTVQSRQTLDQFTQRCKSLNIDRVLHFLNCKLEEPTLDVQMKSLHAIEYLLRSSFADIANKVLIYCTNLQRLIDKETGKLQSKANKVLHSAKSQSLGSPTLTTATASGNPSNQVCRASTKDSNSLQDLLGANISNPTTSQQTQDNHSINSVDIFQGLQLHSNQARNSPKQELSSLSDFDLLNISVESKQLDNKHMRPRQNEIFDPLDMGFNENASTHNSRNTVNHIIGLDEEMLTPSLSGQKPLLSTQTSICKNGPLSKRQCSNQSDLTTKGKDKSEGLFDDLLGFTQASTSTSSVTGFHGNQTVLGFQENQSGQTSQTGCGVVPTSSPGSHMLYQNQNGQTLIPNQASLTSHSGLASSRACVSQTSFPVNPGLASSQTGFVSVNPVLQNLLMTKTSQHSTIPLNLAKPSSQKSDFEFLTKSKKDKAFSFVQDEIKASKK